MSEYGEALCFTAKPSLKGAGVKLVGGLLVLLCVLAIGFDGSSHPYPELGVFVEYQDTEHSWNARRILLTDQGAGRVDLIDVDPQSPPKVESSFIVPAMPHEVAQLARQITALSAVLAESREPVISGVADSRSGPLIRASDGKRVVSFSLPYKGNGIGRDDLLIDGLVNEIDAQAQVDLCRAIEQYNSAEASEAEGQLKRAITEFARAQQSLYDWRVDRAHRYSYLDCWELHDYVRYPSGMDDRQIIDYAKKRWANGTDGMFVMTSDGSLTIVHDHPGWISASAPQLGQSSLRGEIDPILRRLQPDLTAAGAAGRRGR